ncbi:putative high-affinity nitrate transporter-activating protein 2.2 [Wolffia australiana]
MEKLGFFLLAALVFCSSAPRSCLASGVSFASLPRSLIVSASPEAGQDLKAGKDTISVTWQLNQSFPAGTDAVYKTIRVELCYAPVSQKDRGWRKTNDNLHKDKSCPFKMADKPYAMAGNLSYQVTKEIPTAVFFVRAYALDAAGVEVGYGQTTDKAKTQNLFKIDGISGRSTSIDVAAGCFSAFSIAALVAFFVIENKGRKTK